jgi:Lysophospholipase L1 and related esterases
MKRRLSTRALAQVSILAALVNACFFLVAGPQRAWADPAPIRIVAFGDSLTAGYGLKPSEAFPAQLQRALKEKGYQVEVINAGVSGDTTAAGLQRFDWAFPDDADAAIVALGANDALRGIDPEETRRNLDEIMSRLNARDIPVLIAGMKSPRNWGDDYVRKFDAIYAALAEKHGALLYPFFIEKVVLRPELNLDDGMHPNAQGVAAMVEDILPEVEELISRVEAKRRALGAN